MNEEADVNEYEIVVKILKYWTHIVCIFLSQAKPKGFSILYDRLVQLKNKDLMFKKELRWRDVGM